MPKLHTAAPRLATADFHTLRPEPKRAEAFYLSPAWRSLMAEIIRERGRRCQECGRTDCRIFGDHVKELRDRGPPLDKSNIMLRCGSCHTRKTAAQRALRMAAPAERTQG